MKKVVLTLTASLACLAAFGQGKIGFQTDSAHLAYYNPNTPGIGGTAVTSNNAPVTLMADLYMGTSSASLSYYSSTTFQGSSNPGKWNTASVQATSPFIGGGSSVFIITQVRDAAHGPAATLDATLVGSAPDAYALTLGYGYYGWSQEFTFTLGGSVTYPAMYNSPTWTAGTFNLDSSAGAGARGAIMVSQVPEPTSFALLGLGTAAMLIFRRRK